MNSVHFHLLINHFPIIVPIIALLVLIFGFWFQSDVVKRTALALFVFGALLTFPTMFTGEEAEDIVENLPGVTEAIIENHEEKAEIFAYAQYGLGLLSLIGLWAGWKNKRYTNTISLVVLIGSLAVLFLGWRAGSSGGEIRHTEIRADFDQNNTNTKSLDIKEENDD